MTSDLDQEIRKIRDEIIVLSSMVEKAMMDSSTAMKDHDLNTSGKILRGDLKINKKRFELEGIIIHVIAT